MKKIILIFSAVVMLMFSSCKFQLPKSVKVKTNADYNFNVMSYEKDLNEIVSISSLTEKIGTEGSMEFYSYNPGGTSKEKQILISMPFQKIPLDFSEYLNSMDLTVDELSVDQTMAIPEIKIDESVDISLDYIKAAINGMVTFKGITSEQSGLSFVLEDGSFEKVVYSHGKIRVYAAEPNGVEVSLILANGNMISGNFYEGEAVLYMYGNTELTSGSTPDTKMKLRFSGSDFIPGMDFIAAIDTDSEVSAAYGVKLNVPQTDSVNQTINSAFPSAVKSCTVGAGELSIGVKCPEEWSGVNIALKGNLSGAINVALTEGAATSLADVIIDPTQNINFDGEMSVTFDDADITFNNGSPKFAFGCSIENLKEAVVTVPEGFNASTEFSQPLPEEATKMLKKIVWKPSGIAVSCETDFPPENALKIEKLKSDFFGLNETDKELGSTPVEYYCADGHETVFNAGTTVDFAVTLSGFSYDDVNKTMTLKNIDAGKTYNFNLKVAPKIDWFKIVIDPTALNTAQEGSVNTGFDKSALFGTFDQMLFGEGSTESISDYIQIKTIPLYLFCNIPDVLKGMSFNGLVKAYLGTQEGDVITPVDSTATYLLGSAEGAGTLNTVSNFNLEKNEKGVVTNDLDTLGANKIDFKNLLWNSEKGSLFVDFNLSLGGKEDGLMTFVNPAYSSEASSDEKALSEGNNNIEITAVLPLSLAFEVTKEYSIDVMKFINSSEGSETPESTESEASKDLFGRQGANIDSTTNQLLDVVEGVDITYAPTKLPFASTGDCPVSIEVGLRDSKNDKSVYSQKLKLSGDTISLDPYEILNTYPLAGELKINLEKGDLYIPQDMNFAVNIILRLHTDGTIDITDLVSGNK